MVLGVVARARDDFKIIEKREFLAPIQEPEEFICRACDYEGKANKPETLGACWDRRRLRGAAGRKTLFGRSEPDVTLANGCCEYEVPLS